MLVTDVILHKCGIEQKQIQRQIVELSRGLTPADLAIFEAYGCGNQLEGEYALGEVPPYEKENEPELEACYYFYVAVIDEDGDEDEEQFLIWKEKDGWFLTWV